MTIDILNGNELIVKGALEAGFSLYTGYPGSPLADFFNILYRDREDLKSKGIKVVIANSEANAAAMASGAKQAGRDVLVAMKSMGLHVASDALSVGNFANPGHEFTDTNGDTVKPGVVIVVGDDPWSISTSTPADSRYLFKHLHIPFLEPSTPQELKDWMKHALYISRRTSVYQGILLTTYMAEGGGRVEVYDDVEINKNLEEIDTTKFDLSQNVMVPPNSLFADVRMIEERFPRVKKVLKELSLDETFGSDSEVGFISSGVIFETLKQVLEEGGYLEHFSLYKSACSYPLVDELLLPWLKTKKSIIVVEEKRGFLEVELVKLCQDHGLDIQIVGKDFGDKTGFPQHGGLSYEIIVAKLGEVFTFLDINPCKDLTFEVKSIDTVLPRRLPTFCPGCPHRETLSLLKDLRKYLKGQDVDLVSHGDVGCYSLSFLPPFKEMHNLSAMGQGGALGAGMDMFTKNPSVVLMGDSTFFHSGITDVSNSVQCGHNITYILLDNDNTAMTGHQQTPSSGVSVDGFRRPEQNILSAVKALGVRTAVEVSPSDRYFYQNLLKDFVSRPGVKVIVSNKECALTFHGRRKSKERKAFAKGETLPVQQFFQINTSACEDCRVCVDDTGCPGLSQTKDAYGTKVTIDQQICVSDSYCTKIKACPSFELVEVFDYHPTKYKEAKEDELNFDNLPLPNVTKDFESISNGDDLRIVVTGVGGSGITTVSTVLAQAAKEMDNRADIDFKFVEQKGLAQRNGNVTAHLALFKRGKSYGAVTPKGTADLLLSPDILDGSRHLGFLSNNGICLIDKRYQVPLGILLDNEEDKMTLSEDALKSKLKEKLGEQVSLFELKELSYHILGKSVYASAMLLGTAFQSGKLPFSLENMNDAFSKTMKPSEYENNIKAFHIGRKIFEEGDSELFNIYRPKRIESRVEQLRRSIEESLAPWESFATLNNKFEKGRLELESLFPELNKDYLAHYIHDLVIFDRGSKVFEFLDNCKSLKNSYEGEELEIALRTIAKTYWIKDEVFVSHLMINNIQKGKDKSQYSNLGTSYKVTHINRPSFDILGRKFEFDINPKDWMLKIMRHCRFLRPILPGWHKKENAIGLKVRNSILKEIPNLEKGKRRALKKLENIKGYRDVRYQKSETAW